MPFFFGTFLGIIFFLFLLISLPGLILLLFEILRSRAGAKKKNKISNRQRIVLALISVMISCLIIFGLILFVPFFIDWLIGPLN